MDFRLKRGPVNSRARCTELSIGGVVVHTPAFMPVGTQGSVKAIHPHQLREMGAEIILANTYHLSLRPGADLIKSMGGLHKLIGWDGALLTDSGGFQIFSMHGRHKVTEEGVSFYSHIDGGKHFMSPEECVRLQKAFGSDIMMVLDHCVPYPSPNALVKEAMETTCRWAERSIEEHRREESDSALFAIQQGGFEKELRRECAQRLMDPGFDGYAVGGLSVGEPNEMLLELAELCARMLPEDKPRYLMGVGTPEDLLEAIGFGFDMFDCVLPTRNARTGMLYTSRGRLVIKHSRFREDPEPIDPECSCSVCKTFSRAYLRHLFVSGEILASMLNTHHNLHFFLNLMRNARGAIDSGRFSDFKKEFVSRFSLAEYA